MMSLPSKMMSCPTSKPKWCPCAFQHHINELHHSQMFQIKNYTATHCKNDTLQLCFRHMLRTNCLFMYVRTLNIQILHPESGGGGQHFAFVEIQSFDRCEIKKTWLQSANPPTPRLLSTNQDLKQVYWFRSHDFAINFYFFYLNDDCNS